MREIKFRAWEKKRKGWITGFNLFSFHNYFTKGIEPSIQRYEKRWTLSEIVLEQYTGLKDKNGKEIYEGDVLGHMSTLSAGYSIAGLTVKRVIRFGEVCPENNVLSYSNGFWAFGIKSIDNECPTSIRYLVQSLKSEVIGNIHENPELLEDK